MTKIFEQKGEIDISSGKCLRIETKISEDGKKVLFTMYCEEDETSKQEENEAKKGELKTKKVKPTLDNYMKAMEKMDYLEKKWKEERTEFERKNHKVATIKDIPSYEEFSNAIDVFFALANNVEYCGKKAISWYKEGFKNENKKWKIKEVWSKMGSTSYKILLERDITWKGTLEEYVRHYDMQITSGVQQGYREATDGIFIGRVSDNIPKGFKIGKGDYLEVWINPCS